MLMIRLQRRGKKNQVIYRLGVGEKRSKLNGEQLEYLGWFDPRKDTKDFNKERIDYWMSKGAQLSPTVNNLLIKYGVIKGKKIAVHNASKKSTEAEGGKATEGPETLVEGKKKEEAKQERKEDKEVSKPEEKPAPEAGKPVEVPKDEKKPEEEVKAEEKV